MDHHFHRKLDTISQCCWSEVPKACFYSTHWYPDSSLFSCIVPYVFYAVRDNPQETHFVRMTVTSRDAWMKGITVSACPPPQNPPCDGGPLVGLWWPCRGYAGAQQTHWPRLLYSPLCGGEQKDPLVSASWWMDGWIVWPGLSPYTQSTKQGSSDWILWGLGPACIAYIPWGSTPDGPRLCSVCLPWTVVLGLYLGAG